MDCSVISTPQAVSSSFPKLTRHPETPIFNFEITLDMTTLISHKEFTPLITSIVEFWRERKSLLEKEIKVISAVPLLTPSNQRLHAKNITICNQANTELQDFHNTLTKTVELLHGSLHFWGNVLSAPGSELITLAGQKIVDRKDKLKMIESIQKQVLAMSTEYENAVKPYQNTINEQMTSPLPDSPVLVPEPTDGHTISLDDTTTLPEAQPKASGWSAWWFGSKT